jgi:predicted SAM-dependent methyltransferase
MRKLEIGAKKRIDNSWETLDAVDWGEVDVVANIEEKLPVKDNSYDLVYMSHVLEHVTWYRVADVLKELHRILKKGGELEIFVPDVDKLISVYRSGKVPDKWYKHNPNKDSFIWFIGRMYAHGDHPTDFHRGLFNKSYLRKLLKEAGFRDIQTITKQRGHNHGFINLGMKGAK